MLIINANVLGHIFDTVKLFLGVFSQAVTHTLDNMSN